MLEVFKILKGMEGLDKDHFYKDAVEGKESGIVTIERAFDALIS